jgi:tRNA U34 5-methylaminomethyl-2-thiouridine-forming methyltransferase MnmC
MDMSDISIINTSDGSPSLYNHALQEPYHSRHGALSESLHVFIKAGLDYLMQNGLTEIRLLEVGLGTGLNACLAADWARSNNVKLHYLGTEPFPPDNSVLQDFYTALKQSNGCKGLDFYSLPAIWREFNDNFSFRWEAKPVRETISPNCDIIFMDAFAPEKAPDLWTVETLTHLAAQTRTGGILVSYCAKGDFRRALQQSGWNVVKLPGPPGKREMIRAVKG